MYYTLNHWKWIHFI